MNTETLKQHIIASGKLMVTPHVVDMYFPSDPDTIADKLKNMLLAVNGHRIDAPLTTKDKIREFCRVNDFVWYEDFTNGHLVYVFSVKTHCS